MMKPLIGCTMNLVTPAQPGCPSAFGSHYVNVGYVDSVRKAGGVPVALPYGDPAEVQRLLDGLDGLLVTGGWDLDPATYHHPQHPATEHVMPEKSRFEVELVQRAEARDVPILGVCLGAQVINVSRGGTLYQHLPEQRPGPLNHREQDVERRLPSHKVIVAPGTLLASLAGPGELPVNSIHHQGVDQLGEGLLASAAAEDGLVEALEDPRRRFLLAVQWHPEDMTGDPRQLAIFQGFVAAARRTRIVRGEKSPAPPTGGGGGPRGAPRRKPSTPMPLGYFPPRPGSR